MSQTIKRLSQDIVNKIAAGEVVERPASIVKELIENSIDANATEITISIEDGGLKKILVVDNGKGMSKEDLKMSVEPHATSKINNEEDLLNIKSYGFRGEALASISAVSKFTIKSRSRDNELGYLCEVSDNKVSKVEETGMPYGTSVRITDLFYNIPARREFLKSSATEYRKILETFINQSMIYNNVGFKLKKDGKSIYNLDPVDKVKVRIDTLLSNDISKNLVKVNYDHSYVKVYGYISEPKAANKRAKNQHIFVNKRSIKNKTIVGAIKDGYGSYIMPALKPSYVIILDVSPNLVDVNVHPRKEEVRFSNEKLVFMSVRNAIMSALEKIDLTPTVNLPYNAKTDSVSHISKSSGEKLSFDDFFNDDNNQYKLRSKENAFNTQLNKKAFWNDSYNNEFNSQVLERESFNLNTPGTVQQVHNLYLIVESPDGIVIYDQHAVHERINYEKLTNEYKKDRNSKDFQEMLVPEIINLSAGRASLLKEHKQYLTKVGFKFEDFGTDSFKVVQIPSLFTHLNIKELVDELLDDLEDNERLKDIDEKHNRVLTYLSCRSAIKAGDKVNETEAKNMLEELKNMKNKYTCPHGRPLKIEITLKELEKLFKRTI